MPNRVESSRLATFTTLERIMATAMRIELLEQKAKKTMAT
jgi:hypothetical protein